jgi:hypothetical protein
MTEACEICADRGEHEPALGQFDGWWLCRWCLAATERSAVRRSVAREPVSGDSRAQAKAQRRLT